MEVTLQGGVNDEGTAPHVQNVVGRGRPRHVAAASHTSRKFPLLPVSVVPCSFHVYTIGTYLPGPINYKTPGDYCLDSVEGS